MQGWVFAGPPLFTPSSLVVAVSARLLAALRGSPAQRGLLLLTAERGQCLIQQLLSVARHLVALIDRGLGGLQRRAFSVARAAISGRRVDYRHSKVPVSNKIRRSPGR